MRKGDWRAVVCHIDREARRTATVTLHAYQSVGCVLSLIPDAAGLDLYLRGFGVRDLTAGLHVCHPGPGPLRKRAHLIQRTEYVKILIVEDEPKTGSYLRQGLSEAGYVVDLLANGVDGLHLALEGAHDLIVLDVMLPGIDGWQVLQELRRRGRETPVLFLTAKDHVEDRVKGLELGADDYLVKPFSFSELLARVRTILRRGKNNLVETTMLTVADLELDLLRRRVSRGGKRIDLTAKEFGLLELLMRRHGEVLPRSLIASQVWDMNFDSDTNVIDVAIRRLRAKMDDPFEPKLLQTVRGMGYVLEAPEASP
jgi:two-component system copper resistance phosphate regulon response regulator CusR